MTEQHRQDTVAPRSRWLVLTVMCVGYFLVLLDVTVVNVALPRIGEGLQSSVSGLQWVVDAYTVGLAALLLGGGTIGDLHGHQPVVLTGLVVFGVASLAAGLAPVTGALIAARAVQGVGAALLLPGTLAIVSRAFRNPGEQARAIGIWAGVGSVALPAGPLLGGVLVQGLGWRSVFFLNVPIVACATGVVARIVQPEHDDRVDARLDRGGTALAAIVLATATFAVIQSGHSGLGVAVIALAVVALLALAGFLRVERKSTHPMLPLGLFRRPAFSTANVVAAVMNLATLGLLFLLTLFLQSLQHRSALAAGVAVLPLFLPVVVLAPVAGRITAKVGPKPPMLIGLVLAAAGVALLSSWTTDSPYLHLLPAMLCWGVGLGLLTPAVVSAAIASVPRDRSGLASGVNNTARQAGGAFGIASYGAIAGQPGRPGHFLNGLHVTGLVSASLFALAAVLTGVLIPRRQADSGPSLPWHHQRTGRNSR
jgi:DHA2 family methylenomycin A resistance protein-like MFS transporter